MYKITTLLDMAKENKNLKSDRDLAKLLDVANITPYRNRGAVPNDETAKRLADLCDLKYESVLASCHGAIAKKNNDPEAVKAWRTFFRLAQNMAFVLVVFVASLFSFGQNANAQEFQDKAPYSVTSETEQIYIMRLCATLAAVLTAAAFFVPPMT